jgi:hypothetical protein
MGRADQAKDLGAPRPEAWIEAAKKRLHHNVLAIALVNKLARIAWSVLARGRPSKPERPMKRPRSLFEPKRQSEEHPMYSGCLTRRGLRGDETRW